MQKTKRTIVISGSASQLEKMRYWHDYWEQNGREVLAWPEPILEDDFASIYPKIHKIFYARLASTDMHFVANETKNGIEGYIGPGVFAEISFRIGLNMIHEKNVPVILLQMPSRKVHFYNDIVLWKSLGWLRLYEPNMKTFQVISC